MLEHFVPFCPARCQLVYYLERINDDDVDDVRHLVQSTHQSPHHVMYVY